MISWIILAILVVAAIVILTKTDYPKMGTGE